MTPNEILAQKLAEALTQALNAYKAKIIAASGGPLVEWAAFMLYPKLLDEVPALADVAIDTVSLEFGSMTVNDFMAIFATRLEAIRSRPV